MTSWMGSRPEAGTDAPRVVILFHVHELDEGEEDVKIIGVYSDQGQADAAQARASLLPGFSEAPEGFQWGEYELDRDEWTEGYVTLRD